MKNKFIKVIVSILFNYISFYLFSPVVIFFVAMIFMLLSVFDVNLSFLAYIPFMQGSFSGNKDDVLKTFALLAVIFTVISYLLLHFYKIDLHIALLSKTVLIIISFTIGYPMIALGFFFMGRADMIIIVALFYVIAMVATGLWFFVTQIFRMIDLDAIEFKRKE